MQIQCLQSHVIDRQDVTAGFLLFYNLMLASDLKDRGLIVYMNRKLLQCLFIFQFKNVQSCKNDDPAVHGTTEICPDLNKKKKSREMKLKQFNSGDVGGKWKPWSSSPKVDRRLSARPSSHSQGQTSCRTALVHFKTEFLFCSRWAVLQHIQASGTSAWAQTRRNFWKSAAMLLRTTREVIDPIKRNNFANTLLVKHGTICIAQRSVLSRELGHNVYKQERKGVRHKTVTNPAKIVNILGFWVQSSNRSVENCEEKWGERPWTFL